MAEEKLFIEASEEDVPSIIALRQRIWDTTYRGIYPDSMIDNFDWDWHREMELLRVHHPAYSVYLVRKDRQDIDKRSRCNHPAIPVYFRRIPKTGDRPASVRFRESVLQSAPGRLLCLPLCPGES